MKNLRKTPAWSLLAAVALGLVLGGCGTRLTAEERVDRARAQLEQGDPAAAAIHLRNVLQEDPTNVPARVLLARSALAQGDLETAAKEFQRAVDLGAEVDEFRVEYAESLVRAGGHGDALRITEGVELSSDPALYYWRALALLQTEGPDAAEPMLQALAAQPAWRVRATIALARAALGRRQPETALEILAGLKGEPEAEGHSDYWETSAMANLQLGRHEQAADAFARAADTVIDAVGARRFFYRGGEVEALLGAGRLADARTRAERLHAQARQNPLANYLMGRIELQSGNPQQALAYGQAIQASAPNAAEGHMLIGMAHLALNQGTQAERSLERAVAANPDNVAARRLLAQARLGMQSPERALEALGPMTGETMDSGLAALAGIASVRAGDPAAAVEIFRRQLEREPENDEIRSMLAVSLMSVGRVDEALAELGRVSADDAAMRERADLLEVAAHLQAGGFDAARDAAKRTAEAHPDSASLRVNLGGLYLSANRLDEAEVWLEDGLRLDPDSLAARFNLGRIAAAMGRIDEAQSQFQAILARDATNTAALGALAQLDWARNERAAAIERLQTARAADPGVANVRILLAGYLASENRLAEAEEVAREAVAAAPESTAAANALGAVLLQAGKPADAIVEFNRAHTISPGEALHLVNRARAEVAVNDLEAARESLVRALALDGDSIVGLGLMVEVDRRLGRLDSAARTFARLERLLPAGEPRLEILRGELLLAQENYTGAERAFAAAVEAGAGSRAVIGQYEALRRAGNADPEQPLQEFLATQPDNHAVRSILASHYIQVDAHADAIAQYEKLLEALPDNALMMNNLAWLYTQVGDPRARTLAEQAHERLPDNPMIADTLGWILHLEGDNLRALELLRKAAEAAPRVGEIQYHYAVVLAETGDTAGAIRAARAVLAEPAAANHHESAQKLLDKLEPR